MNEGFINTVLSIFKNSMVVGMTIVVMTVLLGILRHAPGSQYFAVVVLIFVVALSLAVYTKRETNRWR